MASADQVRMATDIAAQFRHLPPEDGVAAIVTHLRSFWAPSMRAQLVEVARSRPETLDPLVRAAAERLDDDSPAG